MFLNRTEKQRRVTSTPLFFFLQVFAFWFTIRPAGEMNVHGSFSFFTKLSQESRLVLDFTCVEG